MPVGRPQATPEHRSGILSRLAVLPNRPERTVLYVDGRRAGDIATEVAQAAGLREGDFLSEEAFASLQAEDEPHRARSRALRLLSVRDRSIAEVESRLRLSGFTAATAATTTEWLEGLGYLDDERFAERYVGEKSRTGWGERRIRAELLAKGVGRATVDAALTALSEDEEGETERSESLAALVQRRFGRQWQEDRDAAARRLTGFLLRRGYDWETVSGVIRRMDASP